MDISLITLILGALFVLYGLYTLYKAYSLSRKVKVSRSWPETTGTVTAATVKSSTSRSSSSGRTSNNYWTEVAYRYSVLGIDYQETANLKAAFMTKNKAAQKAEAFPAGKIIPVRYNPDKPSEVVTEFDTVRGTSLFEGIITLVLGVLLIYFSL